MRRVIRIRRGATYGPDHVDRLHAMVARRLSGPSLRLLPLRLPHRRRDGPQGGRRARAAAPLDRDLADGTRGIWGKSRLRNARLRDGTGADVTGPVLDLDVAIRGDLAPFLEHGRPEDVVLAREPNTPLERLGRTSICRMPVGALAPLRGTFRADPQGVATRCRPERRLVPRHAPGGVTFWPKGGVAEHWRE